MEPQKVASRDWLVHIAMIAQQANSNEDGEHYATVNPSMLNHLHDNRRLALSHPNAFLVHDNKWLRCKWRVPLHPTTKKSDKYEGRYDDEDYMNVVIDVMLEVFDSNLSEYDPEQHAEQVKARTSAEDES